MSTEKNDKENLATRVDGSAPLDEPRATASTASDDAPQTAYDLLERVAHHIEEEPRRYDQSTWALLGKERIEAQRGEGSAPACGTVCCRAGWIVALHDGLDAGPLRIASGGADWDCVVEARAQEILDLGDAETETLFSGAALAVESDADYDDEDHDYDLPLKGTREYAQLGADGLRTFMREYKSHLKARKLSDVPKLGRG